MKNSLRQFDRTPTGASARTLSDHAGFTMVELLIAVSILVILTTLTVSAFTVNDADRVGNSIGTFKNALEGARSRAINSGEIRGLRLLLDPNDPDNNMVRSVVYIGSAGTLEGELRIGVYDLPSNTFAIAEQGGNNEWGPLGNYSGGRRLIRAGSRIEIPANSGRWYVITQPTTSSGDLTMRVAGLYLPGEWVSGNYIEIPSGANFSYRLELEPIALDGADPILLDPQTCIDLGGSRVPGSWRVLEDKDNDRSFDAMMGDDDENSNGQFDYAAGYNTMDILFAPDGTLSGTSKTSGVMNFHFAYVSDVVMFQANRQIPQGDTFPDFRTYSQFMVQANPEKEHKVVTIFPQTGAVITSEIDPTVDTGAAVSSPTSNGFNDRYANSPFSFALDGQESN